MQRKNIYKIAAFLIIFSFLFYQLFLLVPGTNFLLAQDNLSTNINYSTDYNTDADNSYDGNTSSDKNVDYSEGVDFRADSNNTYFTETDSIDTYDYHDDSYSNTNENYYTNPATDSETTNIGIRENLTATIISPGRDATVSGVTHIKVTTSAVDISVKINISDANGNLKLQDLPASYQYGMHIALWDTTTVADGWYNIKVDAYLTSYEDSSQSFAYDYDEINVKVENTGYSEVPEDIIFPGEVNIIEPDQSGPLEITFVEKMESPMSGEKRITISPNQIVDKVDFNIVGPKSEWVGGIPEPSGDYYFKWNTIYFPNGYYTVSATAYKGSDSAIVSFSVNLRNEKTSEGTSYDSANTYNSTSDIPATELTKPDTSWDDPAKDIEIYKKDEGVDYYNEQRPYYDEGYKDSVYSDDYFPTNEPYDGDQYDSTREPAHVEVIYPECEAHNIFYEPDCREFMSMSPECREKGFKTRAECEGYMFIPQECREKNMTQEECDRYMRIAPECRMNNILDMRACEEFMYKDAMPDECKQAGAATPEECNKIIILGKTSYECQQAGITDPGKCEEFMRNQFLLTPECRDNRIHDPISCKIFMAKEYMPRECQEAGVTTKDECDYLLRNKFRSEEIKNMLDINKDEEFLTEDMYYNVDKGMPRECQEAGIVTPDECERIMFIMHMPSECKKAGASTKKECDRVMFMAHMPPECQRANIADPEECEKHMMKIYMAPECQAEGASTKEECERILFKKHAPLECREANILDPEECDKYIFEKHIPSGCLENGIKTAEACKKYMFEKYDMDEEVPVEEFPIECQQAGANTLKKCDKVMKELYMPYECKKQGITDEKACEEFMRQKYIRQECRDAGAKTREECDKIMFKKYSPQECRDAGIDNEIDCENFMFNKYSSKVKCNSLDDWQCKNSIKDRHIGSIVAKQVKFREIKEKVLGLAGESVNLEKIEEKLEVAKDIIPLARKQVGLKVMAAKEDMSLDENDNLTQTAPIAFMIDSDEDGLPDDLEKRLGTNPKRSDTDGDGYLDGVEFNNRYNPSGEGKLERAMAPIDQAIIANKILGQPKLEGEESSKLAIRNIKNLLDEEGNSIDGYELSGEADPNTVITLYIYTDLPVVVTVDVDEYGNWQYNFIQSLVEGEHEIYVAVNDNTGRVVSKSNPLSFFIKEAKAVSVTDFVAPASTFPGFSSIEKDFIIYYIFGGLAIFAGIALFFVFYRQKKNL